MDYGMPKIWGVWCWHFHSILLTLKAFFIYSIDIISWFGWAPGPGSFWQPWPRAHFPPAAEGLFPLLCPRHTRPPSLPRHSAHSTMCFLALLTASSPSSHVDGWESVPAQLFKMTPVLLTFQYQALVGVEQAHGLQEGLFWAHFCSSVPPPAPPSTARMSGRIGPQGKHLTTIHDLISFGLRVLQKELRNSQFICS